MSQNIVPIGVGDGVTSAFTLPQNYKPSYPIYRYDWQGRQLLYPTARTEIIPYNVVDTGWGYAGAQTGATYGNDATGGPDGGPCVYWQEGTSAGYAQLTAPAAIGSIAIGDYRVFVVDFKIVGTVANNENEIGVFYSTGNSCFGNHNAQINVATGAVLFTQGLISASYVGPVGNGFARFAFILGPATVAGGDGNFVANPALGATFIGNGATQVFMRPDGKVGQTVSSGIANSTSGALTLTDYTLSGATVNLAQAPVSGAILDAQYPDVYDQRVASRSRRGGDAVAITPSDTFQISTTRGLFVAVGGNIAVTTAAGNTLLMVGVPSGETIPIRVNQVLATGTTATGIIGLY